MSRRFLTAVALLLLTSVPALNADAAQQDLITQKTLPNGLHLSVVHDPVTDIAAYHLALELSSADFPEQQAGITEIIQQLMLDRLKVAVAEQGKLSNIYDAISAGGSAAIGADDEYVEAQASLPSELLPQALQATGELFFGPQQFTDEQLADAKASIVSGYEGSLNAVGQQTFRLFRRALLGKSPLAYDVSTILTGIAGITTSDVASCRARAYVPSRAYLTVVSVLPTEEVIAVVEQAFEDYKAAGEAHVTRAVSPPAESVVRVGSGEGMAWASLIVGVPLPPYGTRGFTAGQVAYMLLAGTDGRLTGDQMLQRGFGLMLPRRLYEEQPPFQIIAPGPMSMPVIAVHIVANPAFIEDARVQVLGHIEAIRRGQFSEQELQAAKDQLINQYALAYETYLSRAQLINLNALFGGDPQLNGNFPTVLASISADEVVKAAEEYFTHHAIGVQMPAN